VAAYLRGTEAAGGRDPANKVLERLTAPSAPGPVKTAAPPAGPTGPAVDERKLAALAQPAAAQPVAAQPEAGPETKPADLAKANEKLSALLGKPKP